MLPTGVQVVELDSAGVVIVSIRGTVDDLPTWRLAEAPVLEISGNAPPYLGRVGEAASLSDGRLLVEDQQTDEVRLFQDDGSYALVGGPGEGPGEFSNVTELSVAAGDTFVVFDRRLNRVSTFSPAGALLSTLTVPREGEGFGTIAMDAWAIDSDRLVLERLSRYDTTRSDPHPRRDQRDVVLFPIDGEGRVRGDPVRFPGGYSAEYASGDATAPLANRPSVVVREARVAYTSGLRYEVAITGPDLELLRVVRWDMEPQPVEESLLVEVRDTIEADLVELRAVRPDIADQLLAALFSERVLPRTLPAVGRLLWSGTGGLWVSTFQPTTHLWREERAWHLLDAAGHPVARLILPERSRLVAADEGRVVLVQRDELDVEHVRVFTIVETREPG